MSMQVHSALFPIVQANFFKMGMNVAKIGKAISTTAISTVALNAIGKFPHASAGREEHMGPKDKNTDYFHCIQVCDRVEDEWKIFCYAACSFK